MAERRYCTYSSYCRRVAGHVAIEQGHNLEDYTRTADSALAEVRLHGDILPAS